MKDIKQIHALKTIENTVDLCETSFVGILQAYSDAIEQKWQYRTFSLFIDSAL